MKPGMPEQGPDAAPVSGKGLRLQAWAQGGWEQFQMRYTCWSSWVSWGLMPAKGALAVSGDSPSAPGETVRSLKRFVDGVHVNDNQHYYGNRCCHNDSNRDERNFAEVLLDVLNL